MNRALLVLGGVVSALSVAAIGFAAWKMRRPPMVVLGEQVAPLSQKTVLEITTTQLSLDGTKVLDLDSLPAQRERGMKSEWKKHGPKDLAVVPLIQALETARGSGPRDSELAVKVAPDVPYRILIEALFSSGEAGYGLYRLSTSSPPLQLPARKPTRGKGRHVAVFIQPPERKEIAGQRELQRQRHF